MKRAWFRLLGYAIGAYLAGLDILPSVLVAQPPSRSSEKKVHEQQPKKRLFVVAPKQYHPVLQDFIQFKRKYVPIELKSLEDILASSTGVDHPECVKRFLYNAWKKESLGYLLLVGDVDIMPVRYMVLDRVTPAAFDYAFYPSDLYYADLANQEGGFDDWNAQKDDFHANYFGEVRGEKNKQDLINFDQVDYRPDIAVGRWPVSTPREARIVAAKSIAYEKAIRSGKHVGTGRASFFHVGGWVDARDRINGLADSLGPVWQVERYFFRDGNPKYTTPNPDEKNLMATLGTGAALIVHVGHGSTTTWDGCFSTDSLKRLKNADRLPVLISVGCGTAYFAPLPPYDGYVDIHGRAHAGTNAGEVFTSPPPAPAPYQKGKFNPTGLGEQVLKVSQIGAVAYIGCNTGSQPCALTLGDGFVTALANAERPNVGDCWTSAVRDYYVKEDLETLKPNADWYPPSIFFQGMKFMLFGDPTLPLAPLPQEK